jgi:hypothetical protein
LKRSIVLVGVWTCALCGCTGGTDGLPRQAVSGTVAFEGAPLASGSIQFEPDAGNQGTLQSGGVMIAAGRYELPKEKGLLPGKYKVRVFSPSESPASGDEATAPGPLPAPPRERIPKKYNVATTLTAEVRADSANVFDFELK